MKKILTALYFAILLGELLGIYFESVTRWITKPLLMSVLLIFYVTTSKVKNPLVMLALITALLGDLFLLINIGNLFVLGLFCFMIMHLMYLYLFWKDRGDIVITDWISAGSVLGAAILAIVFFIPHTGSLMNHVVMYIVIIATMTIAAIFRKKALNGYFMVVFGALLFMVSDTLLAVDKFVTPLLLINVLVMLTYGLAQYCIIEGYSRGELSDINSPQIS